jgi:hypothetical protein
MICLLPNTSVPDKTARWDRQFARQGETAMQRIEADVKQAQVATIMTIHLCAAASFDQVLGRLTYL